MVVVRDVFQLQFGKSRDALDLLKRGREVLREGGYAVDRLLVDVTGEFYTVVMESRFESLAAFEEAMGSATQQEAWRETYRQLVPLVRSGRREVLREVA